MAKFVFDGVDTHELINKLRVIASKYTMMSKDTDRAVTDIMGVFLELCEELDEPEPTRHRGLNFDYCTLDGVQSTDGSSPRTVSVDNDVSITFSGDITEEEVNRRVKEAVDDMYKGAMIEPEDTIATGLLDWYDQHTHNVQACDSCNCDGGCEQKCDDCHCEPEEDTSTCDTTCPKCGGPAWTMLTGSSCARRCDG